MAEAFAFHFNPSQLSCSSSTLRAETVTRTADVSGFNGSRQRQVMQGSVTDLKARRSPRHSVSYPKANVRAPTAEPLPVSQPLLETIPWGRPAVWSSPSLKAENQGRRDASPCLPGGEGEMTPWSHQRGRRNGIDLFKLELMVFWEEQNQQLRHGEQGQDTAEL